MIVLQLVLSLSALPLLTNAWSDAQVVFDNSFAADFHRRYGFPHPVNRVAIIGGGVGGLISYRELARNPHFTTLRLFERDSVPGGNWHYTDETPLPASYPARPIEVGDYTPSLPPDGVQLPYEEVYEDKEDLRRREFRAPKPLWKTLHSNAPAPHQQITEFPWPLETPWELPHATIKRYLRAFASWHGVNANDGNHNVSYNTRVELAQKIIGHDGESWGWKLTLKELVPLGNGRTKARWWTEEFDALVVATGRYNAANIPSIPGLPEWARSFPSQIIHSREYRHPGPYTNQTVLIVGAATSGGEIARDLIGHVKQIYQSIRPDNDTQLHFRLDNFLNRIPHNVSIIPEIRHFRPLSHTQSGISAGEVELTNGTVITGIDRVILATGFRYSFPFLPHLHNSSIIGNASDTDATIRPVVTDGTHLRNLHLDFVYIPDPTIGFINMNIGMQSFVWAEYLAASLSKIWSKEALLPSTEELWKLYWARVNDRGGLTRRLQFLGGERSEATIRYIVGWLNSAAVQFGGRQIDLPPKESKEVFKYWVKARFGVSPDARVFTHNEALGTFKGSENVFGLSAMDALLYNDW